MVQAISLGQIQLHSYLNQPFRASVPITHLGGTPIADIRVNLASAQDFERAGITKSYQLSQLKFSIGKSNRGGVEVMITSHEKFDQPFMQLLLEVSWPQGQFFRAYTVLLDPPRYALDVAPNHQASARKKTSIQSKQRTKTPIYYAKKKTPTQNQQTLAANNSTKNKTQLSQTSPQQKIAEQAIQKQAKPVFNKQQQTVMADAAITSATFGPVKHDDSLWKIAEKMRPNDSVSVDQTMLAILGTNPHAFSHSNINSLKVGYTLKIPTLEVIKTIPKDKAEAEVRAQDTAWKTKNKIEHVITPPFIANVPAKEMKQSSNSPKMNSNPIPHQVAQQQSNSTMSDTSNIPSMHFNMQQQTASLQQQKMKPVQNSKTNNQASHYNVAGKPIEMAQMAKAIGQQLIGKGARLDEKVATKKAIKPTIAMAPVQQNDVEQSSLVQNAENNVNNNKLSRKTLSAELAISAAAVTTARQSNIVLGSQLNQLQKQNETLQNKIEQRNQQIASLKNQLASIQQKVDQLAANATTVNTQNKQTVATAPAVLGQTTTITKTEDNDSNKLLLAIMSLLILALGGSTWFFYRQRDLGTQTADDLPDENYMPPITQPVDAKPVADDASPNSNNQHTDEAFGSSEIQTKFTQDSEISISGTQVQTSDQTQNKNQSTSSPEVDSPFPKEEPEAPAKPHVIEFSSETKASIETGKTVNSQSEQENQSDDSISEEALDQLAGDDLIATKLDLAAAYLNMGNLDSARKLLTEALEQGNEQQKQEAQQLLSKLDNS